MQCIYQNSDNVYCFLPIIIYKISKILNNRHLEVCLDQVATTIVFFPCENMRKDKTIMESQTNRFTKLKKKKLTYEFSYPGDRVSRELGQVYQDGWWPWSFLPK